MCGDRLGIAQVLGTVTIGVVVAVGNVVLFLLVLRRKSSVVRWLPVLLVAAITVMVASERDHRAAQLRWTIDGAVTDKYHSEDHGALSFRVRPSEAPGFEYVNATFWEKINLGDHVTKVTCSPFATVNGVRMRMLGHSGEAAP